MKISRRKILVGLVLLGLAAVVFLGLRAAAGPGSLPQGERPAEWMETQPAATPLPTLVFDSEPSRPWALVKTLGLLMFAMAGLLVIGVFAAGLMVRLRNKIIER